MYPTDPRCRPDGCPIEARLTVALSRKWQVSDKGNFIARSLGEVYKKRFA